MTPSQLRLYQRMNKGSNSMELLPGGQVSNSAGIGASISQIVGNPAFKAEISIQITTRYYSQAVVGTPAPVVPPAGQQNPLPLYLFGNIDSVAKYSRARQQVPGGAGFTYADMAVIFVGDNATHTFIYPLPHAAAAVGYTLGTTFNGLAVAGDVILATPMAGFVAAAAATTVVAETLIHCNNVPYTSLLAALQSDLVTLNMIRYVVPAAAVAQFANQITLIKGSLFGKVSTDTLDPQTFITPGTFQPQIADIPITLPIDKYLIAATQITYTAVVPILFTWTITVSVIDRVTQ
jgi:hypothetical protein